MSNTLSKLSNSNNEDIDLTALFHELLKNKWLILLIIACTFGCGAYYASTQIPQYQSDILLQIEANKSGISSLSQNLLLNNVPIGNAASLQIALIKSRYVLEPVVKSLGLDISAAPKPSGSFWKRWFYRDNKTIRVKIFQLPINLINQRFMVVVDKPAHFSVFDAAGSVILKGTTGLLVTNKAKTISLLIEEIKAPIGTIFELSKRSNYSVIKSLANMINIEELGNKVIQTGLLNLSLSGPDPEKLIRILNTIAQTALAKNIQKRSEEVSQTLSFLYKQLPITKQHLEIAESKLNDFRNKNGKIEIKSQIEFLLNQLVEIDKELMLIHINKIQMMERYTAAHPTMIALETQIQAIKEGRKVVERRLDKLPMPNQLALNMMRDVKVKQALYMLLLNKIQELEIMKAGTLGNLHILSTATLPDAPLPLKQSRIYVGSILIGLVLSILIIFGRKLFSTQVDDPHWIERHHNLANLAIVPFCKEQAKNTTDFKKRLSKVLPLLAHSNPRNLTVESLRSLRTSLQVTLPCANNNIISILGVAPSVGKSFVAANLAYLLATGGKRVLLIDGDLRRGTLHREINVSSSPGLADVIDHKVTNEAALKSTMHKNMTFLPRGSYPKNPSEQLISEDFTNLLHMLSKQFDVVVIDTAPILLVTDAVIIGRHSATNYLVLGANAHAEHEIEAALKRLAAADVRLQGSIFNFFRIGSLSQYYGKYGKYNKYQTYYYDESLKS